MNNTTTNKQSATLITSLEELNKLFQTGKFRVLTVSAEIEIVDQPVQPSSQQPCLAAQPAPASPADIVNYALNNNATSVQLAAMFGGKAKDFNALMLSHGYKQVFGQWRHLEQSPKEVDLTGKVALIRRNCLDGFRLRSIAKEYGVEDTKMADFINNTLHLHWDDAKKMWLKN